MDVLHSLNVAPVPPAAHLSGDGPFMRAYWHQAALAQPLCWPSRKWWQQMLPLDQAFVANLALVAPGGSIPSRDRRRLAQRPFTVIVGGGCGPADYDARALRWIFGTANYVIVWSASGWRPPAPVAKRSRNALATGGRVAVVLTGPRNEADWGMYIGRHRRPSCWGTLVHGGAAGNA